MESVAPLVRLFFGELIATLRRSEPHPEREPWPVTIMFDEFDQIGRMPVIISSLKQLRSHNARVSIITQSVPGLHSTGYSEQVFPAEHNSAPEIIDHAGDEDDYFLPRERRPGAA